MFSPYSKCPVNKERILFKKNIKPILCSYPQAVRFMFNIMAFMKYIIYYRYTDRYYIFWTMSCMIIQSIFLFILYMVLYLCYHTYVYSVNLTLFLSNFSKNYSVFKMIRIQKLRKNVLTIESGYKNMYYCITNMFPLKPADTVSQNLAHYFLKLTFTTTTTGWVIQICPERNTKYNFSAALCHEEQVPLGLLSTKRHAVPATTGTYVIHLNKLNPLISAALVMTLDVTVVFYI